MLAFPSTLLTVDEVIKLIVRSNVRIYGMEGNVPTWALHQSSVWV
jgi:hypothetical protein